MGHKVRPNAFRLGIIKGWSSRWFPKNGKYRYALEEDIVIRNIINSKIKQAGIVSIDIERGVNNAYRVFIKVARPGLVIGRGGKGIEDLAKAVEKGLLKLFKERGVKNPSISIRLNVDELKRGSVAAQYLAQQIAWDLEKRLPARRTMKKYLDQAMQNREIKGARIKLSGRIDGNEISRREWMAKGKLPLQTLRSDIDYGEARAHCTYGTIGVKVWLYKGDVFEKEDK